MSDEKIFWLIAQAAACLECGEEHQYRQQPCTCRPGCVHVAGMSWAHPRDGHAYRRRDITVDWLREWAEANRDS